MALPFGGFKTTRLDHLGLVAAMFDELKLGETLDNAITQDQDKRKVSIGQAVKAMVLNGLGFVNQTLYLSPTFFEKVPIQRLISADINAEHLNEKVLGRCLDTLFDNDLELLFCKMSMVALKQLGLANNLALHLDSTSFHVHGQCLEEPEVSAVKITHGYSKDHRPDLKQLVLNLITENQAGIPFLMSPADGNSQDKKGFREIITQHIAQLKAAELSYLIADSALYSAESLQNFHEHQLKWITRVPETSLDTRWVLEHVDLNTLQPLKGDYRYCVLSNQYAGIQQRWLVIHSPAAQARSSKTVLKQLEKATLSEWKQFEKFKKKTFACQQDALTAHLEFCKQLKYSRIENHVIEEKTIYKKSGRPTVESDIKRIDYSNSGNMSVELSTYQDRVIKKGFFILATNECDSEKLSDLACFELYKDQNSTVERGFRFLKDPMFMMDNLFLKTPRRIMALMMIMTLCLMVYAAVEFKIRRELTAQNISFPNQKKKMIQNPTARWVFFYFKGIDILTLPGDSTQVINLNQHHLTIIGILGAAYEYHYS